MEPEKQTLEEEEEKEADPNPAARDWLPEALTVTEDSNRHEIFGHVTSLQTAIVPITPPSIPLEKDASQVEHPYRFQRSDVWKPVYSWLESFDTDNLIKSQDILDWLTENPEIREQLYVKHSRYHVMHYIKKCHIKILKRREKKKGVQSTNVPNPIRIPKTEATKQPVPVPYYFAGNASNNLPKDSDTYASKRSEAVQKYEILLELEKQLSVLFPNHQTVN